jgi:hypothetical protein
VKHLACVLACLVALLPGTVVAQTTSHANDAVGNTTHFVLYNVSIDDFVFGVAAVDSDGHQNLISAYVASDRPIPLVKLAN